MLLGLTPLLAHFWVVSFWSHAATVFTEILPGFFLLLLLAAAWFGGRPLWRLAEGSFWSLNALAVQPAYVAFREGFRHLAERLLPARMEEDRPGSLRAWAAAISGGAICAFGLVLIALAWPASRWTGDLADLTSPHRLIPVALANSVVLISGYFAAAALIWGIADATMPPLRNFRVFHAAPPSGRTWRVAHLSDIHTVGERFGFRIECGRFGPRGNDRVRDALARLDRLHAEHPLDVILITGDLTDAGRAGEWAEFFAALAQHPPLAELVVALPGNHDLNVVDRANPARLELPGSRTKRLREVRTMSALGTLQGDRLRVVEPRLRRLGGTLAEALKPHAEDMAAFADSGSRRLSRPLAELWAAIFPMVLPPRTEDGVGMIVLNSNAEAHFSFTNALGLVSAEQAHAFDAIVEAYPRACWVVALHHHVMEYPAPAKALSVRIGTALVNGSWFVRRLQRLAGRVAIMHGHRHIDWTGECGGVLILSAPSPVMGALDAEPYFYVHTFGAGMNGRLHLLQPERISVRQQAEGWSGGAESVGPPRSSPEWIGSSVPN